MEKVVDNNLTVQKDNTCSPAQDALNLLEIIKILAKHNALTTKNLADKLSKPFSANYLRDQLNLLNNAGLVRSEGTSNRNKRWIIIK